ncbi:MAG: TonB-dependent receptor [Nonlabens sp.]|uniref:TonB-dependent receptor n=1 Tax=Nonlabens sp. TaxID=1888209 RepID=UPI003EF2AC9F
MLKPLPLILGVLFSTNVFSDEVEALPEPETIIELEEVSVVGTKRAQKYQEVVQSVVVLEEKDFIGLERVSDALKFIPNITYETGSFLPTIRGLNGNGIATGGGGAVSGARPRMSFYVDGVARSYSAIPDGDSSFWDVEQVEVYRGSQSTQLGRNALAGAIVQTTKDPKFKDEYAAQVGIRDQETTYNTAFMANKKISDQVAIRLTGEAIRGNGFMDFSGFQGTGISSSNEGDLDDISFTRFRFKALVAPTEVPDLKVKLTLDRERSGRTFTENQVNFQRDRRVVSPGNYSYVRNFNSVASLSANYFLTDEWELDGILSYQSVNSNFGPPIVGSPDPSQYLDFNFKIYETTFETKINYFSEDTRTSAVAGLFYLTRSRTDLGAPGSAFVLEAEDKSKTRSLFADAAFQISPKWDLLLGGRLERDQQKRSFSGFGGFLTLDVDEENNVFLPKIGATYHVTPEANISLLAYKGYTASGGGVSFTTFTPYLFDKESAITTELSTRTQWLNKKLTANANIFYTSLKDTQVSGIGPGGPADLIFLNVDEAKTYGAELELSYQPNKASRAFFSLGLLKTEIENFGTAVNDVNNGNEFELSPDVTARVGGYTEVYPNLTIGGDVAFTAERFSDYQNVDQNKVDNYMVTNINTRYVFENLTFTAFANNLFNKNAILSDSRGTGGVILNVNAPRTVGVNVRIDL